MIELDTNTPHGHTPQTARREGRLLVSVTMRADQMSQMLPDGRGYSGAGPHEIQIYKSDERHLQALVEPCSAAQLADLAETTAEAQALWCKETKRSPLECPISFSSEYRTRYKRDLLPVVSYKIISEMDTIALEAERKQAAAREEASATASVTRDVTLATTIARAVADELAKPRNEKGRS